MAILGVPVRTKYFTSIYASRVVETNYIMCDYLCSGGCGAMYEIHIESDEFKGKRTVHQHQLVNQVKYVAENITSKIQQCSIYAVG